MTRTEENNEKIHSEFFITKRLAEHILQVEEVKDCYLVGKAVVFEWS